MSAATHRFVASKAEIYIDTLISCREAHTFYKCSGWHSTDQKAKGKSYKRGLTQSGKIPLSFSLLGGKGFRNNTIVFDSVSRMSRNAEEGIKQYFELYERGVVLVFLKEGYINTEVFESTSKQMIPATGNDIADIYIEATNKVIKLLAEKQIAKAFEQAQKEVDDLHVRTSEGMKASHASEKISRARTGNTYVTAKSKEMKGKIKKMAKCYDGTMTDKEVMEILKLARNTYYKYKREIEAEMQ